MITLEQSKREYVLNAIRTKLKKLAPDAKAILFGSKARGNDNADSDWDILILLDKPKLAPDDFDNISYPLIELGWELNELISPKLYTINDWMKRSFTLFYKNVEKEGIAL